MADINIKHGYMEVNGTELYYETAGSGPDLLFIHSGIADNRMWDDQFATFANHYRVTRYDMRGYGRSPAVPGEFSHVEDLFELAKALKIKSPTLIGSSKGGTIALDFILQHPKFSAGLVMIGSEPSGFKFTGEPPPQWEPLVTAFKAGNFEKAAELEVEIWVVGPQRSPEQVDAEIRQLVKEMDLIALRNEALGGMEEQPPAETAVDQLEGVNVPTLVLFGELDDPNVLRAAGRMVASIPGVQSAAFPKAAHFPNLEEPKRFNQILEDFLTSI